MTYTVLKHLMMFFGIVTVIVLLKSVDSKFYNNVMSVDRRQYLSGIDNNAFPCINVFEGRIRLEVHKTFFCWLSLFN